jgi:hypothetical protein
MLFEWHTINWEPTHIYVYQPFEWRIIIEDAHNMKEKLGTTFFFIDLGG